MKKLGILAAAAALTAGTLNADIQVNKYLSLGGHVDMSYVNTSVDETGAVADQDTAGFSMDQAEIDFKLNISEGLTARVDLQAGSAISNSVNIADETSSTDGIIEQARIDYAMGDWTLTMGKFDTFIGLEGLEPVDMYQFSNSLTFSLEPTQHTGLAVAYDNGFFNAAGALVNSATPANPDNNDDISIALHAGVTPNKAWAMNLNFATGNEADLGVVENDSTLLTADVQWSNYGWTTGLEFAKAEEDLNNEEFTAYELMGNYMFTERFGLTLRYSTCNQDSTDADAKEFTISPSYAFTPNWLGLIEYRSESVDAGYTKDNTASVGQDANIIALETTLSF
ncbi:MAG: outer membrane beta-barrel protein [Planctomycetes bacterium]|nr:outer membrane beta-barrel protein [Planctomycetota bacterium]